MPSILKRLLKDSVIYGLGGIIARSCAFLVLPIYTRIFSPSEYGIIEMLTVISSFLGALLSMGLESAQSVYFIKYKKNGINVQSNIVSSVLQWRLIFGFFIVLAATFISPILNSYFFDSPITISLFYIAFFNVLFQQVFTQSTEVLRLLFRPWSYVLITTVQTLTSVSLILLFIVYYDYGIFGYFLGSFLSSIALSISGWFMIREYIKFSSFHFEWWPRLIRFGAPLVPASLGFYFMNSLDRWFVQHYHGIEALGLFSIGAKFSILIALGVEMFRKAWWPIAIDAMYGPEGPQVFRTISRFYVGFGVIGIILLTLISPWLLRTFTSPAYYESWPIVGILSWQSMFYGFFLIAAAGLTKVEKTYLYPILMGSALFFGTILNYLLVPQFNIFGAAIATALTYLAWIIVSMIVSEKFWSIGLLNRIFISQILLGILACVILLLPHIGFVIKTISSILIIVLLIRISIESETINLVRLKLPKYN